MSNILLSKYSKAVDKAIRRAQDRSGWVDYYQAGKLEENLWEILGELSDECLPFDPETAFYASLYLYKRLGETELDDSGGTISALTDECEQVWLNIYEATDELFHIKMFAALQEYLDSNPIDYIQDTVEDMMLSGFEDEELLPLQRVMLERKLAATGVNDWYLQKYVVLMLGMMEREGRSMEERDAYARSYWRLADVRKIYIARAIETKHWDEAIALLQESIDLDRKYAGLVKEYRLRLKDIYKQTGRSTEYMEMLWLLVKEKGIDSCSIKDGLFAELKAQYNQEEWLQEREKIFAIYNGRTLAEMFKAEKLYDRLMELISATDTMGFMINEYAPLLKKHYTPQLLQVYERIYRLQMDSAGNRKAYYRVLNGMKAVLKLEGGRELSEKLIAIWRVQYPKRRALQEEMSTCRKWEM